MHSYKEEEEIPKTSKFADDFLVDPDQKKGNKKNRNSLETAGPGGSKEQGYTDEGSSRDLRYMPGDHTSQPPSIKDSFSSDD